MIIAEETIRKRVELEPASRVFREVSTVEFKVWVEGLSQIYEEKSEEDLKFVVFFLNDDEDQSVHVEEVEEVDFFEIIQHINMGGSIFMTQGRKPNRNISSKKDQKKDSKILRSPDISPIVKQRKRKSSKITNTSNQ